MSVSRGRRSQPAPPGSRPHPAVIVGTLGLHALLFAVASRTVVEQSLPSLRAELPIEVRLRFEESTLAVIDPGPDATTLQSAPEAAPLSAPLMQLQAPVVADAPQPATNTSTPPSHPDRSTTPPDPVMADVVIADTPGVRSEPTASADASPALASDRFAHHVQGDAEAPVAAPSEGTAGAASAGATAPGSHSVARESAVLAARGSQAGDSASGNASGSFIPATLNTALKVPRFLARAAGRYSWRGDIEVLVELDLAGQPRSATLQHSSGHADLDDAARRAALGFSYSPALKDGVAVATRILVPFRF